MRYEEFACHPLLEPYVRVIWLLELDRPGEFGSAERIMPDGIVEVVFSYGASFDMRFAGEPFTRQAGSFAVSQTKRFVEIHPDAPTGFVSVRFHPWGAYHFFGAPISEFADRAVGIEDLWGRDALDVQERIGMAGDDAERVAIVQRFLLERLRRHAKSDVHSAVQAVWDQQGRVGVTRLCRELGVTERTLERTFAAALGASPKHFTRLTRFLLACDRLRQRRWTTLAEVATTSGYYDQSHFNADFKAFSGLTPREFLSHEHLAYLDVG